MRSRYIMAALAALFGATIAARPAAADEDIRALVRDEISKHEASASKEDPKALKVTWDNGLKFSGKNFKGKIGGRLMFDVAFIDDADYVAASGRANSPTGTEFRRVRLYTSGEIGKHVGYKVQLDFAGGETELKDVYMDLRNLRDCAGCGFPDFRIGQFKEPFGLEELTSSKYITFIERSIVTEAFAPSRSAGIMAHDNWRGDQMGYQLGVFANQTANFSTAHDANGDSDLETHGWGVTGRYWWAPWFDCNCPCRRLHVGVSASYRTDMDSTARVRFRARPGIHLFSHRAVDTGGLAAEDALLYGAELAWVYGPWSLQAEYMGAEVSGRTGTPDGSFWGFYAQASYWLTGECRNYKQGKFDRVKPCCNWLDNDCCCKGAWELAVRYNFLDLNDGAVLGGEQTVIEAGVNWHLNPNARIMFNVVWANVDALSVAAAPFDEDITAFVTRFQVDF